MYRGIYNISIWAPLKVLSQKREAGDDTRMNAEERPVSGGNGID